MPIFFTFFLCYIPHMKHFAICYNSKIQHASEVKDKLTSILSDQKVTILDIDELQYGFDFVFVIGGDGTILKTARFFAKTQNPVFGINLGRLGFLSQSNSNELEEAVERILTNDYIVEDRIMLKCDNYSALNDFVIKGCDARTSKFSLKINDKFVCDYLADGIIVSTPTGSTAYGLSAGGPVLTPSLNAFVIVPICAHTLNARPIVVPDSEKITVCIDKNSNSLISADGQEFYEVREDVVIEKLPYNAKLALLKDNNFYSILKNKLHWATPPAYEK